MKAVLVFLSVLHLLKSELSVGDLCLHSSSNKNGMCKRISECPSAIQELMNRLRPQTCSFQGTVPIVCCPFEGAQPTPVPVTEPITIVNKNPSTVGVKSTRKCHEYAKEVYQVYPSPLLSQSGPKNVTRNECAIVVVKLIVGGVLAKQKEFPHMANIGFDNNGRKFFQCGGSLISDYHVLTAGHCLSTRDYGQAKYVRLGVFDLSTSDNDEGVQDFLIDQIIPHPEYKPPSQYNDIALLKLDRKVTFTKYVRPICLNLDKRFDQRAMATGWGNVGYAEGSSDKLLKVTLDHYANEECSQYFDPTRRKLKDGIRDTQLCAGSKEGGKDTCQGDSGGPLQIYNVDEYCMYTLVGVTSFGKACGIGDTPGVYTKVAHFAEWIESVVWP